MNSFYKITFTSLILASLTLLTSCGNPSTSGNKIVKDVSMTTKVDKDGDAWVGVKSMFQLGSMSMTSITLPINDPYDKSKQYGKISLKPTFGSSYNEVGVSINLTDLAKLQGGFPTLPNNEDLPVGNLGDNIIELEIEQIHSKIYFGLARDLTLVGFAIAIKEFQLVGEYIKDANIFLGFNIRGFEGTAGFFTGDDEYENGLAFFADFSKLMTFDILDDILAGKPITQAQLDNAKDQLAANTGFKGIEKIKTKTYFINQGITKRNLKKLYKVNKKLGRRRVHYIYR